MGKTRGVTKRVTEQLTFKLWIPNRAAANKEVILKEEQCEYCLGSGEEEVRFQKGFGYSHIPCKFCRGLGRKKPNRHVEIVVK